MEGISVMVVEAGEGDFDEIIGLEEELGEWRWPYGRMTRQLVSYSNRHRERIRERSKQKCVFIKNDMS